MGRKRAALSGLSAAFVLALPPGAHAAEPPSAAQQIWGKLLTRCGDSYFYGGSFFDHGGMLSTLGAGEHPTVIEFRGVRFNSVPIRITDAERMNGLEAHMRISMLAHLYRDGDGPWLDGPDMRPRNVDDIMGKALQDIVNDAGELGNGGAIAFDLAKVKGGWIIARSSTTLSGPLSFSTNYYDVSKILALRSARYNCASHKMELPPPTAAEIAAQKAKEAEDRKAAAIAEAARKQQEAVRQEEEAKRQAVEAERQAAQRRRDAEEARWRFTGDSAAFIRKLVANLNQRAGQYGFDPHSYHDELVQIADMVDTCMDAAQVAATSGGGRRGLLGASSAGARSQTIDLCNSAPSDPAEGVRLSPPGKPFGLAVRRKLTSHLPGVTPGMSAAEIFLHTPGPGSHRPPLEGDFAITVSLVLPPDAASAPDTGEDDDVDDRRIRSLVIEGSIPFGPGR